MSNKLVSDIVLKDWQEIINLLAEIANIPAALIMRLDKDNIEVYVTSETAGNPYTKGAHERFNNSGLYCEKVIKTQKKLIIPNALKDPEWNNNPDIKLNMISYLGYPLSFPDHEPFGTICILDNKENSFSPAIDKLMVKFKNIIELHLQILYINQIMGDKNKSLTDYINDLKKFKGMIPICANCKKIRENDNSWELLETYLSKHPEINFTHTLCPECVKELYPDMNL